MRRSIRPAVLAGIGAWLAALALCMEIDDARLTSLLMPLWRAMSALAGRGPNLGTAAQPLYEATPVHALLAFVGIALSALVYIGIALAWAAWRGRLAAASSESQRARRREEA